MLRYETTPTITGLTLVFGTVKFTNLEYFKIYLDITYNLQRDFGNARSIKVEIQPNGYLGKTLVPVVSSSALTPTALGRFVMTNKTGILLR